LGIHDVIWPADSEGYNHGWGDIFLHPQDMAKLGFLWLNQGLWDGKQIVSPEWVEASVTPQNYNTDGDGYGYGWWVSPNVEGAYFADGRGGQRIIVVPAWTLVVVTTGGGFEFDEIDSALFDTFGDMKRSLPANPAGVEQLQAALTTITQPPAAEPVPSLPETARTISGQTFLFEPNRFKMEEATFEFDDSAEALMHIVLTSQPTLNLRIGLDNVYRFSPGEYDLPVGVRGYWVDEQTFAWEYQGINTIDHILFQMRFADGRVQVEAEEAGDVEEFAGQLQAH
jgi:hypothetical protein